MFFEYGDREVNHLKMKDERIKWAIETVGHIDRNVNPDLFTGLMSSIIAQQISSKAAKTVWGRFEVLCGAVTPERVNALEIEVIQKLGMSFRKANYISEIASRVVKGVLDLQALNELSDAEVTEKLKSLPGIGIWTAEMLMIFSMQRENIVSWDDLAIRRGIMRLYGLNKLDKKQFTTIKKQFDPFGSVASLYLWEISTEKYAYLDLELTEGI